jgi:hypothetical protein
MRLPVPAQLREEGAQRMPAVELVRAVCAEHQQTLVAERAGKERYEAARGGVRPVQVLDHEQHRLLLGHRLEQRQQRLEHARLLGRWRVVRGLGEPGQDRAQIGAVGRRERVEGRVPLPGDAAQGPEQRRVGELALAELDAVAAEHARARLAGPLGQLTREAGLPDARLTRHERQRRSARGRGVQRGGELLQLAGSTDEARARDPCGHGPTILPCGGRRRGEPDGRGRS